MSEQLKNKMQDFEVSPPPGVWDKIVHELKQDNLSLSQKMYDYEVVPPLGIWQNIITGLKDAPPTVPFSAKPVYKMAVAAAILGVIVVGGWFFFQTSLSKKQQFSPNIAKLNPENKSAGDGNDTPDTSSAIPSPQQQIAAVSDYRFIKAKKKFNQQQKRELQNTVVKTVETIGADQDIMIAAKPIRNERGDIIQGVSLIKHPGNKYIDITGPNGEQTKISAKFINGLLYLNEAASIEEYEGYFDKSFLESLMWKSRFQNWRNKIIHTSFIPSSTNFFDILEFKELLKDAENQ